VHEAAAQAHDTEHIRFIGHVPQDALPALMSAAWVFAFPSLYEGFGIPVAEAMACGTPVLTSNTSSLPEVAGDAALLVDPRDETAIADGLQRIVADATLRETLRERGLRQAAQFSWRTAARDTWNVYKRTREK
jgi:glycosyltransferase involved in cell wall biosynthesis